MEQQHEEFLGCGAADGDAAACANLGEQCTFDETTQKCVAIKQQLEHALQQATSAQTTEEQERADAELARLAEEGRAAATEADPESTTFIEDVTESVGGSVGTVVKLGILVAAARTHPQLLQYLQQENLISQNVDGEYALSKYVLDFIVAEDETDAPLEGGVFQFQTLPDVEDVDLDALIPSEPSPIERDPDEATPVDYTKPIPKSFFRAIFGDTRTKVTPTIRKAFGILEGVDPERQTLRQRIESVFSSLANFFNTLGFSKVPTLTSLWNSVKAKFSREPALQGGAAPGVLATLGSAVYTAFSFVACMVFKAAEYAFDKAYGALTKGQYVPQESAGFSWTKLWNVTSVVVKQAIRLVAFTVSTLGKLFTYAVKSVASRYPWLADKLGIDLNAPSVQKAIKTWEKAIEQVDEISKDYTKLEDVLAMLHKRGFNAFAALTKEDEKKELKVEILEEPQPQAAAAVQPPPPAPSQPVKGVTTTVRIEGDVVNAVRQFLQNTPKKAKKAKKVREGEIEMGADNPSATSAIVPRSSPGWSGPRFFSVPRPEELAAPRAVAAPVPDVSIVPTPAAVAAPVPDIARVEQPEASVVKKTLDAALDTTGKLVVNAIKAIQTPSFLHQMREHSTAIKGPFTLTYHTKGDRAVWVFGEYHWVSSLARAPVPETNQLTITNFLFLLLQNTGVFIDLFLEAEGRVTTSQSNHELARLRYKFSRCFSSGGQEPCASSRTARVHAADPPSIRTQLDALVNVFQDKSASMNQKWDKIREMYLQFSTNLANFIGDKQRDSSLVMSAPTQKFISLVIMKKYEDDLLKAPAITEKGLHGRIYKISKYLTDLDPEFKTTFNNALLKLATHGVTQFLHNINSTELTKTENDFLLVCYNGLFLLTRIYMDAYLLARMFKRFSVPPGSDKPEYAYNSIVYAGNSHSDAYRSVLNDLGFNQIYSIASPACTCNNCETSAPCDNAKQNISVLLTPEQSQVLLTFTK